MVCTKEAPLAERALGVLEVLLRGQRDYEPDLCAKLRPALLQALQRLSVENAGQGLGQGDTEQGKRDKLTQGEYIISAVLKKYPLQNYFDPKICAEFIATAKWPKFIETYEMKNGKT